MMAVPVPSDSKVTVPPPDKVVLACKVEERVVIAVARGHQDGAIVDDRALMLVVEFQPLFQVVPLEMVNAPAVNPSRVTAVLLTPWLKVPPLLAVKAPPMIVESGFARPRRWPGCCRRYHRRLSR